VATLWNVRIGDRQAEDAASTYAARATDGPDLSQHVIFEWDAMDAWFEEDDEVFVHPRDPHHRVDVLHSSRHVKVDLAGQTVAETRRPRLLFETGLPVRYNIPKLDVRLDRLSRSSTVTQCPYKGTALHWNYAGDDGTIPDVAWTYHLPTPECAKIADTIAFYNERVDAIFVDGELQPVPDTPWSRAKR
jgi:uncharacterized protein (DUF427 family)